MSADLMDAKRKSNRASLWTARILAFVSGLIIYVISPTWEQYFIYMGIGILDYMAGWWRRDSHDI